MPSVRKDTTPAEGGIRVTTRVTSEVATTTETAGKAAPQQDAHVEQGCAWWLPPWSCGW